MSMFIEIEGVDGDSTVEGFDGQIEVNSFSFSTSQPTSPIRSNTSHTSGRPSLGLFNLTKSCDSASPVLLQKLWAVEPIATATFSACRDEGAKLIAFLTVEMENVVVANYSVSGGGGMLYENLALNYSKIVVNYIPQNNAGGTDGNIPASYDLATESSED